MAQRQDQDGQNNSGDHGGSGAARVPRTNGENAAASGARREGDPGDLPDVESPNLGDGGEDAAESSRRRGIGALPALLSEPAGETANEGAAASPAQPRSFRFALLVAMIACAAAIGALVGSLSAFVSIGQRSVAEVSHARAADAREVRQALKVQMAELSSLKASLDAANRSAGAQFSKIADRLNTLERAQADPAAKLAHIADAVDRLDKHAAAAPEITGSIAAAPPAQASAVETNLPVLRNWQVEEVHGGRALVESRYGSEFLVGSGSTLPGLGHVQDIKRENGEWMVITEKGIITSGR